MEVLGALLIYIGLGIWGSGIVKELKRGNDIAAERLAIEKRRQNHIRKQQP